MNDRRPRLLIGPLYNPAVLGNYASDPDIKLFMPRGPFTARYQYDLVYEPDQIQHFNQLFDSLPVHWEPDLVIWWDIVYQPILPGIAESRYPTALIPGDWNLAFNTVLNCAQRFDLVFADARLGAILDQAGLKGLLDWPNFAYDQQNIYREQHQRIYDIGFIGNLNASIHPERSRYLNQILSLQDRYQVYIQQGVWGADYRRILNQSKIVFNYTICQVLNMRAYEAPACGALLFIEEANLEARSVYMDGESCIFYNQHNLIERLTYYLEHDAERERIAEAGYQIALNHSYEKSFRRLLTSIPEASVLAQAAKQRLLTRKHSSDLTLLYELNQMVSSSAFGLEQAIPYLHNLSQNLQVAGFIEEQHIWRLQATLSLLFPVIDEQQKLTYVFQVPLAKFREIYTHLIKLRPYQPIFYYHMALVLEYLGEEQQALWNYAQTIELIAAGQTQDFLDYIAFIVPFNKSGRGIDSVVFSWEKIAYTAIEKNSSPLNDYGSILVGYIWRRMGFLLKKQQKYQKSALAFENAYIHLNLVEPIFDLAELYQHQGLQEPLLETIARLLEHEPFAVRLLPDIMSYGLYQQAATQIVNWVKPYLDIFPQLKPIYFLAFYVACVKGELERPGQWLPLLDFNFSIGFYKSLFQVLHYDVGRQNFTELHGLKQLTYFDWKLPLEPAFALPSDCGLAWSASESGIQIGLDTCWQRVYDQTTDWQMRQIGPDLLPYAFPEYAPVGLEPSLLELLSEKKSYLLLLTKESKCLGQVLAALEQAFKIDPDLQLFLWNPDREFVLQTYMPQLENTSAPITWLDENFSPAEQADLLRQTQLIVEPRGQGYYYAHWAWWLGRPVVWTEPMGFFPYPKLSDLYLKVPCEDLFKPVEPQDIAALQMALEAKNKDLDQCRLNILWQIKVRSTLAH